MSVRRDFVEDTMIDRGSALKRWWGSRHYHNRQRLLVALENLRQVREQRVLEHEEQQ